MTSAVRRYACSMYASRSAIPTRHAPLPPTWIPRSSPDFSIALTRGSPTFSSWAACSMVRKRRGRRGSVVMDSSYKDQAAKSLQSGTCHSRVAARRLPSQRLTEPPADRSLPTTPQTAPFLPCALERRHVHISCTSGTEVLPSLQDRQACLFGGYPQSGAKSARYLGICKGESTRLPSCG